VLQINITIYHCITTPTNSTPHCNTTPINTPSALTQHNAYVPSLHSQLLGYSTRHDIGIAWFLQFRLGIYISRPGRETSTLILFKSFLPVSPENIRISLWFHWWKPFANIFKTKNILGKTLHSLLQGKLNSYTIKHTKHEKTITHISAKVGAVFSHICFRFQYFFTSTLHSPI